MVPTPIVKPQWRRSSENTCGADRMDPANSGIANQVMPQSPNAGASIQSRPSWNFGPRRKQRPVLTQIRKNHRIVGADNLGSHKHVTVEPDLAREVPGQLIGDFVVLSLMRHAMNSQDFVA